MSGRDLAREPRLGEQWDYRLGEISMPVRLDLSAQPLFGSKRSRDAAPSSKKLQMKEIEIKTAEISETLGREIKTGKCCAQSSTNTRRRRKNAMNGREKMMSY